MERTDGGRVWAVPAWPLLPAPAPERDFLLFPQHPALAAVPGGLLRGDAGGGPGSRAAAAPGTAVIHSARPRPLGLKFLRLGGSRSLTFLGNFNRNSSEASKKQDDGKKGIVWAPSPSHFYFLSFLLLCFLISAIPAGAQRLGAPPGSVTPPPSPWATPMSPATLHQGMVSPLLTAEDTPHVGTVALP